MQGRWGEAVEGGAETIHGTGAAGRPLRLLMRDSKGAGEGKR
jgi:hypothetical protein